MSYFFALEVKENHLHIIVRGKNDAATIRRYVQETLQAAISHSSPNILIEENLEGPALSMVDVFHIVTEAVPSAGRDIHRIAFVDVNPAHGTSNMKFAETVAQNRGVMMNAFSTVADAEKWLLARIGPQTPAPKRKAKD